MVTRKVFNLFSFTGLMLTSIIGADIYVVTTQTVKLGGTATIWEWMLCGIFALIISLCFAQCAQLISQNGGTQSYVEEAFGKQAGFFAGWILYIAEWVGLIAFPLAFISYIHFFIQTNWIEDVVIKIVFMGGLTLMNLVGRKAVTEIDDSITLIKILPLVIFILIGVGWIVSNPSTATANFESYRIVSGYANFSKVVLLAFWAFSGFEMSVLPAAEVQNPKRNVPLSLILGIVIATIIYLGVNIPIFFVLPQSQSAVSGLVLADTLTQIFQNPNASLFILVGGLVSISGVTFATILELSRLLEKMAREKDVPEILAKSYGKDNLPYLAIILPSLVALVISLVVDITSMISLSVVILSLIYILTGLANWRLHSQQGKSHWKYRIISVLTIGVSIFIFFQGTPLEYLISGLVVLLGWLWNRINQGMSIEMRLPAELKEKV